jgi:hypothetical protein
MEITARTDHVAKAQHQTISVIPQQGRDRGAITILDAIGSTNQGISCARQVAALLNAEEIERGGHDDDQ